MAEKVDKKGGAPNSVQEAGKNWPDGAPDSVKEYEELRANPPEGQEGLTPKPE